MAERVCGAITRAGSILMVNHQHDGRNYWTLPGGGVEAGESAEEAVVREAWEETGLTTRALDLLYRITYISTAGNEVVERCFLLEAIGDADPTLGYDPELSGKEPMLRGIGWFPLETVRNDLQVSRIIDTLISRAG